MVYAESNDALVSVERLQEQARNDRRPSSVPLLVFGALALAYTPLADDTLSLWSLAYWVVAGPAGFLLTAWWYRHRRTRIGIGAGRAPYAKVGLIVLVSFALILPLWALQIPTIGVGLLVLAKRQRNTYLGAFAAFITVFGLLDQFSDTLVNLSYHAAYAVGLFRQNDGYFNEAPAIINALAGMVLLCGGFVALQRERRAGS